MGKYDDLLAVADTMGSPAAGSGRPGKYGDLLAIAGMGGGSEPAATGGSGYDDLLAIAGGGEKKSNFKYLDEQPTGSHFRYLDEPSSPGATRDIPEPSFSDAAAPRQSALPEDAGFWQKRASEAGDALSFVGRALAAAINTSSTPIDQIDPNQRQSFREQLRSDWETFKGELAKKGSTSDNPIWAFIENTLRDPATAATLPIGGGAAKPIMAAGWQGVKQGSIQLAKQGLKEGIVSAATHQAENVAGGEGVDLGEAAGEVGLSAGIGLLFGGLTNVRRTPKILSAEQKAANAAAKRAGIPLTKEQEIASIGSQLPEGRAGAVERFSASTPGGRGVFEKHKAKVKEAIANEMDRIRGTDLTQDEIADRVAEGVTNRLEDIRGEFDRAYKAVIEGGEYGVNAGLLDGKKIGAQLRQSVNADRKIFMKGGEVVSDDIPSGITTGMHGSKQMIVDFVKKMDNLGDVPGPQAYEIFRNEKTILGHQAFDNPKLPGPDKIALQKLYRKANEIEERFIRESGFFTQGEGLVKLLKDTNEYFGNSKAIRDYTDKLIGFNREAGEKGFVGARRALDNLLQPKNFEQIDKIMSLMPPEVNEDLRLGLVTRMLDGSMIENGTMLSLNKLQQQVKKYDKKMLNRVLGSETVARIDDLMTGMQRARSYNLKFADASNKSGTAAATAEKVFFGTGPVAAVAAFLRPELWAAVATGGVSAYANRLIAKLMTHTPVSKVEKLVGRAAATGGRYSTQAARSYPLRQGIRSNIYGPEDEMQPAGAR